MSTVQSIERAFSILDVIAASEEGISVTETSKRVNLPTSTVSRLILTLEHLGAVERLENEHVRIGQRITKLNSTLSTEEKLIQLSRPYLKELAENVGEDAALVVPDGTDARFIAQESGGQVIQVQDWTGSKFPMHRLTAGKLFLAHSDPKTLTEYLSNEKLSNKSFRKTLKDCAKQAYCWSFGEFSDDLNAISAPVFKNDTIVAALTLYGPDFRFPKNHKALIQQKLSNSSRQLSNALTQLGS